MKITENFDSHEIFPKIPWEDVSFKARFLAEHLCKYILQPLKDRDPNTIIKITGPARDSEDVTRLISEGYHPSVTTDHFFGEPQEIPATSKNIAKIKKYGKIYTYSVGAVDIVPDIPQTEKDFLKYFKMMIRLNIAGTIDAGQIILEKGKYTYWIHVSNPATLVYDSYFASKLGLHQSKYLLSLNNDGKYKPFSS